MTSKGQIGAIAYWTLVVLLIGFGALAILTIGLPFLLLGLMLAIVSQRRHEAAGVGAIVGFMVGYILIAPTSCSTGGNSIGGIQHRACTNILGFGYSGTDTDDLGVVLGLLAGLVVAVLCALGTRWLARRFASRRTPPPPVPA